MAGFPINFLSDLVNRQSGDNSIAALTGKSAAAAEANQKALASLLDGLSNGETIVGKILSSSEGTLRILTGDNVLLDALVNDNITLKEGTTALFEVNKGPDNQVSLRPLYQNLSSEETAKSALRQAGLPENERSLEMVARNMEYGNPIDRNSLIESFRSVSLYPDVPVKYIVDLQKMGIPETRENFDQYRAYLNMENSVAEAFTEITDSLFYELSKVTEGLIASGETGNSNPLPAGLVSEGTALYDSLIAFAESGDTNESSGLSFTKEEISELISKFGEKNVLNLTELMAEESDQIHPTVVLKAALSDLKTGVLGGSVAGPTDPQTAAETEIADLRASLQKLTEGLKDILSRAFSSQWSLDKEKVGDKREVRELYNRLFEQSGKLLESLSSKLGSESPVTAKAQNLSNNLQFMNSLNNFVPYIQIPFRGHSGNAGSELYVYKNKKSLSSGDGEISAFVHLDMENLGPTDVYVKMLDHAVTTKFTLKDDEALKLVSDNIDFLNKRLNEKGYSFTSEMLVNEKPVSPMEEMLLNTTNRIMVAKTSFDARI